MLPKKPIQWRVLILLRDLFDLSIYLLMKSSKKDVYLHLKILDFTTTFKLFSKDDEKMLFNNSPLRENFRLRLNRMKVHYFFSIPD